MADPELRETARAVERAVVPPDFERVVARGRQARRRRRRRVVVSAAAVAILATAVALPLSRLGSREPQPAAPPATDDQRAALVLSDPDASVRPGATWVSGGGSVLQRVSISSPVGGRCDADRQTALVWHGPHGEARAWSQEAVGREVVAVDDGFVVGAESATCARVLGTAPSRQGAYTVDDAGRTHRVEWSDGAGQRCRVAPARAGCLVVAATGRGTVVEGARPTPGGGFVPISGPVSSDAWASSSDGTELAWTQDGGRSWDSHRTTLRAGDGEVVQSTASGAVGVFFAWPRVEVTRDHGETWQVRDLESALAPVLVANPVLSVTADGMLAGVSYPTAGRPFVFASTDSTWTAFDRSDFRTGEGDYFLSSSGPWLWTEDEHSVWLSRDGLTWAEVDAVLSAGSG